MRGLQESFVTLYQQGKVTEALRLIYPEPGGGYDDIPLMDALLNYVDSLVFSYPFFSLMANRYLQQQIECTDYDEFLKCLREDEVKLDALSGDDRPYLSLSYPWEGSLPQYDGTVVIFMESFAAPWQELDSRPKIFIFYDRAILWHCLHFENLADQLYDKRNTVVILGEYGHYKPVADLVPVLLSDDNILKKYSDDIIAALTQGNNECLYEVGKDVNTLMTSRRLGKKRLLNVLWRRVYQDRRDQYNKNKTMFAELLDERSVITSFCPVAQRRTTLHEDKIHLAHVVSMVRDCNIHAPSRLLKSLLLYHNQGEYKVSLHSSEYLISRPLEYPYFEVYADPSRQVARGFLSDLYHRGIDFYLYDDVNKNYSSIAYDMAERLSRDEVDVVVIHEMNPVNKILARITDVPYRIFFAHGWPENIYYDDFDSIICSEMDDAYDAAPIPIFKRSFAIDCRKGWDDVPYSNEFFGLPSDAKIITTISNNLDSRLSDDMCWAIGGILRGCPEAYYLAIGTKPNDERLAEIYDKIGVSDRVFFIGNVDNPSQLARTAYLYLNEFPVGGGLAVLDSMASGTPVVTMYDPNGVAAARFGGFYIGVDRAIKSCCREEYVELALNLLHDADLYAKWVSYTLQRYEDTANVVKYVSDIEGFVKKAVASSILSLAIFS